MTKNEAATAYDGIAEKLLDEPCAFKRVCFRAGWDARDAEVAQISQCLAFFASVIKSGESWTDTCQQELEKCLNT